MMVVPAGWLVIALAWSVPQAVPAPTPAPAPAPAPAGDPWKGEWTRGLGTISGQKATLRRNTTAATIAGDARFPVRVGVALPLRGLETDDRPKILEIERLLTAALERDRKAVLVLVITTEKMREFVFYAADATAAASAVAEVRPKAAPYELQSYAERDPGWSLYKAFAK